MNPSLRFVVISLSLTLLTACATNGAGNPASIAKLKSNTAYVGPDGTVLVKGFAGRYTANFVCVLPSGSYRITVDASTKGSVKGSGGGGKGEVAAERETKAALEILYRPQDRMIAVQQVLGNACVMLGNGIFGDTCTKVQESKGIKADGKKWCSGAAPPETLENYNRFVTTSINHLLPKDEKPTERAKPPGDTQSPGDTQPPAATQSSGDTQPTGEAKPPAGRAKPTTGAPAPTGVIPPR